MSYPCSCSEALRPLPNRLNQSVRTTSSPNQIKPNLTSIYKITTWRISFGPAWSTGFSWRFDKLAAPKSKHEPPLRILGSFHDWMKKAPRVFRVFLVYVFLASQQRPPKPIPHLACLASALVRRTRIRPHNEVWLNHRTGEVWKGRQCRYRPSDWESGMRTGIGRRSVKPSWDGVFVFWN